ncbi:BON domain-containing protein [Rivibacter subsaxonicus]|uniref:Osmotically-inducible protein OsmY n=1 Tax=Rivibacter subsaxonicus TaxID=457575 RepID=A0A4Q7VVZ0_9BURK|nr:BON domain-containing protein [Rivibacter subsaxonicus]RZU00831.1 osmotically-inducible protein OsmY [Rivibacter subsaxonicus]
MATLAVALLGGGLSACAPILVGGAAVGSVLMVSDRRTSGTVVEDQGIENKANTRIQQTIGDRGHVNVTSYNRVLLLTGEVPSESDRAAVEAAMAGIENLRNVINELVVAPNSSMTQRSNDSLITSKVKASFVDARDIFANAYKVVTERGVVYLMGRVTEREAARAVEIARGVSGVVKVIRVFEIISEDELAQYAVKPVAPAASGAAGSQR